MSLRLSFFVLFFSVIARAADPAPAAASSGLHDLTYSGDQAVLTALDRDLQLAGKDPAKLTALEKRLLAALGRRDTTFAARQAIAQRLALVLTAAPDPKSAAHKTLSALLVDPRDSDLARLALQPVPGPAIDKLFVDALPKSTGPARLGLLDAIATRRIANAVSAVTPLLRDSDAATASAAARALGEIGTTAAFAALRAAPIELTAAARLAAAARLPDTEALAELRDLQQNSAAPMPVRHAAFRTSLDLDPANAPSRVAEVLRGQDTALKQVALEAIVSLPAGKAVPSLESWSPTTTPIPGSVKGAVGLSGLGAYDAPTQAAIIAALGRRGEAQAVSVVSSALTHTDAAVRAAAIAALGFLPGTPEIVTTLAQIATSDSVADTKLAKQSLARLNGPGVSAAILAGAEKSDATLRPVFLEQLALRNQTEGIPLLFKTRTDPAATPAIRLAALAALGDIAPLSEQRTLLEWAVAATDEAEQSRALRSFVNLALRDPDKANRGRLLFDVITKAPSDLALRLLPALGRIGGSQSAHVAGKLATRDDASLATAAIAALARWNDDTAIPALVTAAEQAADGSARDAARAAALRSFERHRDGWTAFTTELVSRLLKTTKDSSYRQQLLALLHRTDDSTARDLARSVASDADPAVAAAAKTALDIIAANQLGKPKLRASGNESSLGNLLDRKTSTRWNVPTDGEEWLEIDFRTARPLHTITLDQTTRAAEFPERYEVHLTDDPKNPGPVVLSGKGQQTKTVLEFPANTRTRYVLIKNVAERKDSQWSIVELYVD